MAGFRFRLARVLDWYEQQCKTEEGRLRAVAVALESLHQSLIQLREQRSTVERDLIGARDISPSDLSSLVLFQEDSRKREVLLEAEIVKARLAVERQRKVLQEARRRVRLMEKLSARRLAEYNYAVDRELEQLAGDAFQAASSARDRDQIL